MWIYEKKLQYPVHVDGPDLRLAFILYEQYGGPDGELSAGVRYLNQRYYMPIKEAEGILTDIGTEEFAHWEIIATLIFKLTRGVSEEEIKKSPLAAHYVNHGEALFPHDASGNAWTAAYIQAKGDPIADLHEDMAAEQKARATYEHLIRMTDDPGVKDTLKFLREREIVHFQRFGETLRKVFEYQESKRFY
ncbi:rubrerythrin family protein [Anoxybacter fermentans]|uniref:Rubrerythrin family protein n=1 Tax=Anoxybacter fermentans TaxID=1323375 RepID=A0A3S9T0P9_9FIRM|nr:manganese catalase family protein [Anoxybacter fermentans]AZR74138.1 rubrerythrin family protein [Anoxybacter fermentans]